VANQHEPASAAGRGTGLTLLGVGTALPAHAISQDEAAIYAAEGCFTDEHRRLLPKLYRLSGVDRRASVLLDKPEGEADRQSFFPIPSNEDDMGPTMRTRMAKYEAEAGPMACRAAERALSQTALDPAQITHLVTVSCSGFYAPSTDVALIKHLGLPQTIERTNVGFMGCHGAFNGLRVAKAFVDSNPAARVLVCAVEICSIHFQYGWDPEQIVANSLFADGAGAVIGGAAPNGDPQPWRLAATGSCLIPESENAMTWRLGDHGFLMSLSARVPDLICSHLRGWMEGWLHENGLRLEEVASWAVHPGGPRILKAAGKALGLDRDAVAVSRDILSRCGNMSSPTILFILERLRRENARRPCVALGFGPGLVAEAMLFV
jgi:predicted naringenin-chalcone synthase